MNSLNKGWSFTAFFLLALGAQTLFFGTEISAQTELGTTKVNLTGCVKYDHEKTGYVFEDRAALEAGFYRADEYNKICRKEAKSIDFDKYTLLGVNIRNAECHEFPLEHKVIKDDAARLYRLQITHPKVKMFCRGISTHGLWVLAPKLPEGYRATFEISQRLTPEEEEYGNEIRFYSIDGLASSPQCLQIDDRVYNEESLKNLLSFEQCRKIFDVDKVDLKSKTLIGWEARGDCHMGVETSLYRDDKKKLFTLLIKNRRGGCRASGWREGMITIPKIPDDYNVKFVEYKMDHYTENFRDDFDKHQVWSADGQNLTPRPNISPASPDPIPEPTPALSEPVKSSPPAGGAVVAATGSSDETEVKILRNSGSRFYRCHADKGGIYTEAEYQALLANKECTGPQELKVDLKKESLIGFGARGDCHVGARAKVFRNDKTKTYTIAVNKIYGGCRAYGQVRGWIVIKKMHPEYQVKWRHTTTDESGVTEVEDSDRYVHTQTLETAEVDLGGCIQNYRRGEFVIKDKEAFLKAIRNDASNDFCVKTHGNKVDFDKQSLLGIGIISGHCRRPAGVTYKTVRDDTNKLVTLQISYPQHTGICRHIGGFELWVTVPKIPEGFETKFEVTARSQ